MSAMKGWNDKKIDGAPYVTYYNVFKTFSHFDNMVIEGVLPTIIKHNIKLQKPNVKLIMARIGRTLNWRIHIVHNDKLIFERMTDEYFLYKNLKETTHDMEQQIVRCLDKDIDNLVKKGVL